MALSEGTKIALWIMLGIESLENNINIAGVAVLSKLGELIFQTENFDLRNQTKIIINIVKGEPSFVLNNFEFSVVENTTKGIIATNGQGMGHVIINPFQKGILVSYAMPQADLSKALDFLKKYILKLNDKLLL